MKKLAYLAAATSMLGTVHAQECDVIKKSYDWRMLHVAYEINLPKNTYCIGIESKDANIKSVNPSIDKPFCFDLGSDKEQSVLPELSLSDGTTLFLNPMTLQDARDSIKIQTKICLDSRTPV